MHFKTIFVNTQNLLHKSHSHFTLRHTKENFRKNTKKMLQRFFHESLIDIFHNKQTSFHHCGRTRTEANVSESETAYLFLNGTLQVWGRWQMYEVEARWRIIMTGYDHMAWYEFGFV